jgi:Pectinacetylesterase
VVGEHPIMSFAGRAPIIFSLVGLTLMAGLAVATQDVAAALHYPREFGRGFADLGSIRLYPPWAIADWYLRYEHSFPQAFDNARRWGLLAGFMPVALTVFVAATRRRPSLKPQIVQETFMPTRPVQSVRRVWRNVLPAAAPGCSQGTPYSFWVKEGDPKKLAVILSGGGACWTGENCALHCRPHYRAFAGLDLDPTDLGGVFDTDNIENPIGDYMIVYLATANGDVFLGDSVTTYDVPAMSGRPAGKINILHKGYENAASALDWMFKTYRDPKTVAVMGWSAGAMASPLYTHIVAQHYPGALVTHFADGGGAYRVGEKLAPLFKSWGTANVLRRVGGFESLAKNI